MKREGEDVVSKLPSRSCEVTYMVRVSEGETSLEDELLHQHLDLCGGHGCVEAIDGTHYPLGGATHLTSKRGNGGLHLQGRVSC